jgi:benzylsuccinate CoA-transferase BbsE subunit
MLAGGIGETKFWSNFLDWLTDEKVEGTETFREERWGNIKFLTSDEGKETFSAIFDPFALTRSKANLYEGARRWRVPMAPVATPADVLASAQLRHRGFFVNIPNTKFLRDITLPGAPYNLSDSPWRIRLPAPRLGAHTQEILSELDMSERQSGRRVNA